MDKFIYIFIISLSPLIGISQTLSPTVVASGGGFYENGGYSNSFTVGELATTTLHARDHYLTQGFQQPNLWIVLDLKVFLAGPYKSGTGLMSDDLRALGFLPLKEPYFDLGFTHAFRGGNEKIDTAILSVTGDDAIVDWVLVELRDQDDSTNIFATRAALVQRDGDVVDVDGVSRLKFALLEENNFFVAVRHRNHFSVMTAQKQFLSYLYEPIDFTSPSTITYGTNSQKTITGKMAMWSGNALYDNVIKYSGVNNDRDPILTKIGGIVPTNVVLGYHPEDVNMNGVVKYSGLENDRDIILVNIGGVVPTAVLVEKLP